MGVYYGDEPGGKMLDDYVEYKDLVTGDSITKTKYGDIVVQKTNGVVINYDLAVSSIGMNLLLRMPVQTLIMKQHFILTAQ